MTEVLSHYKSTSTTHKMAASCQKEYMLEVDFLFPWLEEQGAELGVESMEVSTGSVKPITNGDNATTGEKCVAADVKSQEL